LVLLAAATSPAWETILVAIVLIAWQVFETLYLQQRVERHSLHLGPFISLDGVHPSAAGHRILAREAAKALNVTYHLAIPIANAIAEQQ